MEIRREARARQLRDLMLVRAVRVHRLVRDSVHGSLYPGAVRLRRWSLAVVAAGCGVCAPAHDGSLSAVQPLGVTMVRPCIRRLLRLRNLHQRFRASAAGRYIVGQEAERSDRVKDPRRHARGARRILASVLLVSITAVFASSGPSTDGGFLRGCHNPTSSGWVSVLTQPSPACDHGLASACVMMI